MCVTADYISAHEHSIVYSWYENGNKSAEWDYDHDDLCGLYTSWYENGSKSMEGVRDQLQQSRYVWFPDGTLNSEYSY